MMPESPDVFQEAKEELKAVVTKAKLKNLPGLNDREKQACLEGYPINAIKYYRERTKSGLREAKDKVDEYRYYNMIMDLSEDQAKLALIGIAKGRVIWQSIQRARKIQFGENENALTRALKISQFEEESDG